MTVFYELWDVESGNRLERFASESEALDMVRDLLEVNGSGFLDALMLGAFEYDEHSKAVRELPLLEGDQLRARLADLALPADQAVADPAGRL
jgi:hypothetical protein